MATGTGSLDIDERREDTRQLTTAHDVEAALAERFEELGASLAFHAVSLSTGHELGVDADRLMPMASMFKLPVLLAFQLAVADGRLDPEARVTVVPDDHVPGSTGVSVFSDPVELSLRDMALLMMSVSDNTATDLLLERVGRRAVADLLEALSLSSTTVFQSCRAILESIMEELGTEWVERLMSRTATFGDIDPEVVRGLSSIDPERTNSSTAREVSRLLELVWQDEAGPPDACAETRRILGLQVWPHRLASGVPEGGQIAAKTGTLPGIRNEAGVITRREGDAHVVTCFTVAPDFRESRPDIDRAIGWAGRTAVEWLAEQRA